jgi:lipopolysaccharide heptosyltransferase II
MFPHLQIPYRRERWLVGGADAALRAGAALTSPFRGTRAVTGSPQRILLLRLERIGDLLMVLDAIAQVRALAPRARIDLAVGSWNLPLARLIPSVDSIEVIDVPWMAREGHGATWPAMLRRFREWRGRRYDLAINFEPDIRSNILMALSGASRTVGLSSGGGAAVLTDAIAPDPGAHIADTAQRLVEHAFADGHTEHTQLDATRPLTRLAVPEEARRQAADLIGRISPRGLTIGIQPGAGRQIKEWDPARFAEVGAGLARSHGAKIVLIGSAADRVALDAVRRAWPHDVPLVQLPTETDLIVLAAVLERLALFITGDTGPMHLAAAVGTPVLAVFGPSLPTRYAPLSAKSRIVRIDIPCSPCNLLRRPPQRCVGHVPDCLAGIDAAQMLAAAHEMLDAGISARPPP